MTAKTTIPEGSIESQLKQAITSGATAEQATDRVLEPIARALEKAGNPALASYARPSVLRDARRLSRATMRRAENAAFGAGSTRQDRIALARITFGLPDGTTVAWADSGPEHHERRVAWLRTYIGALEEDLDRHERALKLLAEHGAARLSDIDGWEDLIGLDAGEDEPASGEVVP